MVLQELQRHWKRPAYNCVDLCWILKLSLYQTQMCLIQLYILCAAARQNFAPIFNETKAASMQLTYTLSNMHQHIQRIWYWICFTVFSDIHGKFNSMLTKSYLSTSHFRQSHDLTWRIMLSRYRRKAHKRKRNGHHTQINMVGVPRDPERNLNELKLCIMQYIFV